MVKDKKRYVASEKDKKARAQKRTVEDIDQNYKIKTIEKQVKDLTKGTKNYCGFQSTKNIPSIIGSSNSTFLNTFLLEDLANVNAALINPSEVEGPSIAIKHIGLNYSIKMDDLSTVLSIGNMMTMRVMVIVVHHPLGQPSGTGASQAPHWSDVFLADKAVASALTGPDVLSTYSRLTRSNFEVLYDRMHTLSPSFSDPAETVAGTHTPFTPVFKVNLRPSERSQRVMYNTATPSNTSYNEVSQNQYFFLAFTDNITAANAQAPDISYQIVVDYIE